MRRPILILLLILGVLAGGSGAVRGEEINLLNHVGAGVAYIDTEDDSTIYLWNGTPAAYLQGDTVYGFNGRHLGWFEEGIVRGSRGMRVGYTEDTIAGVGQTAHITRVKGVKESKVPPVPPVPPLPKPAYTDMDSAMSLFLESSSTASLIIWAWLSSGCP